MVNTSTKLALRPGIRLSLGLFVLITIGILFSGCSTSKKITFPDRSSSITGNEFYHQAFAMKWKERDSFVVKEILAGDVPDFMKRFVPVHVSMLDSVS